MLERIYGRVRHLGRKGEFKERKRSNQKFKKEYWQDIEDVARQKHEEGTLRRGELPGRFMARKLYK